MLNIWISVALTALIFLAGCSDDIPREDPPVKEDHVGEVYIRFRVSLCADGVPDRSRAASRAGETVTPTDETRGTSREDAINSLDLLIYDAATDRLEDIISLGTAQIEKITGEGIAVPVYASKPGKTVYVYAAVNLTDKMRSRLVVGQTGYDISFSSDYNDYRSVINEFVPGSNGHQNTLQNSETGGIPMTGQFVTDGNGSKDIVLSGKYATEETALRVSADVSRIVAKVHVLVETATFDFTDVVYVSALDRTTGETGNWMGWMRLSDVRYMPNGTNKSTYLFPQANDEGAAYPLRDLNMNLEAYFSGDRFDELKYNKDFVFYDAMTFHKENISPTGSLAQTEAFDIDRYNNTGNNTGNKTDAENRYTQGMYCTENYFNSPGNSAAFDNYDNIIPAVTCVTIASKLTPRNIVILDSYSDKMDRFVEEFEANPETFRKKHGLTADDFTAVDAARWKNVIKTRYFANTPTEKYRGEFQIISTLTESDAVDIINWSLMNNDLWSGNDADFEKGKYPSATFYVYDTEYDDGGHSASGTWKQRYLYLTAGAVVMASDANAEIKTYSVPHIGGWGYYYTYLDCDGTNTVDGKTPYTASQVTRNTYYLITISNFGVPGGTITRPEYIKVNTMPVGWDYSGRGDINLH